MVDAVSAAAATAASSGSRAQLAQNFETFLLLLTEQLKNQDPLSPLDSNEFVNQLVQFSSVEQQIGSNEKLDSLIGLEVAGVGGASVSYLGREVRYASDTAPLGDGGAVWAYQVDGEPTSVSIAVKDASGKVVYEAEGETGAGEHGFAWDGKDSAGEPLPYGAYTIDIAAVSAESGALPVYTSAFGIVTGIDLSGSEPVLAMGAASAPFSHIEAVRNPYYPTPDDTGGDATEGETTDGEADTTSDTE